MYSIRPQFSLSFTYKLIMNLFQVKLDDSDKAENIDLKPEVIEQIHAKFEGLSIDEAKQVIFEVTNDLIADLKVSNKLYLLTTILNIF
jgi:hypothetical protein